MLFGASTSGPAVTIQRFTPQEFVAVCTGYNVTITCPGISSSDAKFYPNGASESDGSIFSEYNVISLTLHVSHDDIVVSNYRENVSSLSQELLSDFSGTIYKNETYAMMKYTLNGTTLKTFGRNDYVWEDTSGNYHLLLASNTKVTSTLNHS